jgi:hypothetical protein
VINFDNAPFPLFIFFIGKFSKFIGYNGSVVHFYFFMLLYDFIHFNPWIDFILALSFSFRISSWRYGLELCIPLIHLINTSNCIALMNFAPLLINNRTTTVVSVIICISLTVQHLFGKAHCFRLLIH